MSAPSPANQLYLGPSGGQPEPKGILSYIWNDQIMNPEHREGNLKCVFLAFPGRPKRDARGPGDGCYCILFMLTSQHRSRGRPLRRWDHLRPERSRLGTRPGLLDVS